MKIAVASCHRNSAFRVPRYFRQVRALVNALPTAIIRVVAVEGDSDTDQTRKALEAESGKGIDVTVVPFNHGGKEFGSVDHKERLTQLTKVGNAIFDSIKETDELVVYVESDLEWQPPAIVQLLEDVRKRPEFAVFAPLVMCSGTRFYDVWAFRGLDGIKWQPFRPYHKDFKPNELFEVGSVGSCLVMRGNIARQFRIPPGECLPGWCAAVRKAGHRIVVDPTVEIVQ